MVEDHKKGLRHFSEEDITIMSSSRHCSVKKTLPIMSSIWFAAEDGLLEEAAG